MSSRIRGSTSSRGYGWGHQQLRRALAPAVAAGLVSCARCGLLIGPREHWDLDHRDDKLGYRGAAHRACNRATARHRKEREDERW
jgi:hypothetical protein